MRLNVHEIHTAGDLGKVTVETEKLPRMWDRSEVRCHVVIKRDALERVHKLVVTLMEEK